LFHAHYAARSVRLRHFRDGAELRWIDYDDFYDYDYEEYKFLNPHIRVMPGDHLMLQCDYGTKEEAVLDEMCSAVLLVYTESNASPEYVWSRSWVDMGHQMRLLGIKNYTEGFHHGHKKTMVHEPKSLAGELKEVLSHHFDWNSNLLKKFQELYLYGSQSLICSEVGLPGKSPRWSSFKKRSVSTPVGAILNYYVRPNVCPPGRELQKDNRTYPKSSV